MIVVVDGVDPFDRPAVGEARYHLELVGWS